MRMFLPIKGPGGRYLTTREKIALLILGLTLVLCALTLLAGDGAYATDANRNPVSGFVAFLCRTFGGGIIALYALVLVWSGLIYFKGERVVDMRPLAGRLFATLCVTLGISGVLGIAHLETAGSLGLTVGAAIGNTFGATLGFPILIVLMLLGVHLAGQGAWSAMREPVRATATTAAPGGLGFGLRDAPQGRFTHEPPLPDDGDPSADERTLAITQAMEEIERSKGVTIVDVDPETEADTRPSIGEEVDAVADYDDDTEEADVRRGVAAVEEALAGTRAEVPEDEDLDDDVDAEEADRYETDQHGFVPVPSSAAAVPHDDECVEAVFQGDLVEEEEEAAEDDAPAFASATYDEDEEQDDEAAYDDEADDEDAYGEEENEADDEEVYEDEDDEVYDDEEDPYLDDDEIGEEESSAADDEEAEEDDEDDEQAADEVEDLDDGRLEAAPDADEAEDAGTETADEAETAAETADADDAEDEYADEEESYESVVAGQADGAGEDDDEDDPYAQGGLLRRLRQGTGAAGARDDEDRPYTAFDWRGRPLE